MKDLTLILFIFTFVSELIFISSQNAKVQPKYYSSLRAANSQHSGDCLGIQFTHRELAKARTSRLDYIEAKAKSGISNVRTQQHFSNKFHALPTLQRGGHAFNKVNRETPIPYSVVGEVCSNLTSLLKLNLKQWLFNNMTINGLLCLKVNK